MTDECCILKLLNLSVHRTRACTLPLTFFLNSNANFFLWFSNKV